MILQDRNINLPLVFVVLVPLVARVVVLLVVVAVKSCVRVDSVCPPQICHLREQA